MGINTGTISREGYKFVIVQLIHHLGTVLNREDVWFQRVHPFRSEGMIQYCHYMCWTIDADIINTQSVKRTASDNSGAINIVVRQEILSFPLMGVRHLL